MVTARENPSMGLFEEYICTALLDSNKSTIFSLSPAQPKAISDKAACGQSMMKEHKTSSLPAETEA